MCKFHLTPESHPELFSVGAHDEDFDPIKAADELIEHIREEERDTCADKLNEIYERFYGEDDRFLNGDL